MSGSFVCGVDLFVHSSLAIISNTKSTHVTFLIEFMLVCVRACVCMFVCVTVCVISLAVWGTLILTGLRIRVRTGKLFFLIFQPKHMLWVLKRTVSMRRFF